MADTDDKPEPPAPSECCEGGCNPCVWDIYYENLRYWQERQRHPKHPAAAEHCSATAEKPKS